MDIKQLMVASNALSHIKGWWDGDDIKLGDRMMNIHSEVTEAWEEYRAGHELTEIYYKVDPHLGDTLDKPEGFPTELADVFIRIADLCEEEGIDLDAAIQLKMAYNSTRSYRHGGKKA